MKRYLALSLLLIIVASHLSACQNINVSITPSVVRQTITNAATPILNTITPLPTETPLPIISRPTVIQGTTIIAKNSPTPRVVLDAEQSAISTKQAIAQKWDVNPDFQVELSPDGSWAVIMELWVTGADEKPEMAIKAIEINGTKEWTLSCSQIEGCQTYIYPAWWNVDGKYLYLYPRNDFDSTDIFTGKGKSLSRLELDTGQLTVVLPALSSDSSMYEFGFSPDGNYLMYIKTGSNLPISVSVRNMNSAEENTYTLPGKYVGAGWVSWSPDNHQFLINAVTDKRRGSPKSVALYLIDTKETMPREVLAEQEHLFLVLDWKEENVAYFQWYDAENFTADEEYWYLNTSDGNLIPASSPTPTP